MENSKRRIDICSPIKENIADKKNDSLEAEIDWKLCFICQQSSNEALQSPSGNPSQGVKVEDRYNQLATNITKLFELNQLPVPMNIEKWKGGVTLGKNLFQHAAIYHKKCKKKFDDDKVKRAEKRTSTESTDNTEPVGKQSRRSSSRAAVKTVDTCFFCNDPADERPLHKVTIFKLDARVRQAAKDTNNTILYSKLQNGDMCA